MLSDASAAGDADVTHDRRCHQLGLALVLFAVVAWSTAGYFTRLIPVDSWTMQFWRAAFGAVTSLLAIVAMQRGRPARAFARLGGATWLYALVSGLGMTCFLGALSLTSVAHVAIVYAALPFVAAIMAALALRERAAPGTLLASLAAFAGIALASVDGAGEGHWTGDLVAVGMTLLMGVMIVLARRHPGIPMVPAAFLSTVVAGLIAAPFATFWPLDARTLLLLAAFGASNTALGLILFAIGSTMIPAAESALIGSLEAPLAPFWVWLAFGETPLPLTIAGGALVMAAVLSHVLIGARRVPLPAQP
jgi:drug/metabolite transporter (DMT)-like permease